MNTTDGASWTGSQRGVTRLALFEPQNSQTQFFDGKRYLPDDQVAAMIADWCQQDVNCGDMAEIETPFDPYTNAQRLEEAANLLFDAWIKLVLNKRTLCD